MKYNFVAKHCKAFNKAAVHRDRTKFVRNKDWLDEYEPPTVRF